MKVFHFSKLKNLASSKTILICCFVWNLCFYVSKSFELSNVYCSLPSFLHFYCDIFHNLISLSWSFHPFGCFPLSLAFILIFLIGMCESCNMPLLEYSCCTPFKQGNHRNQCSLLNCAFSLGSHLTENMTTVVTMAMKSLTLGQCM